MTRHQPLCLFVCVLAVIVCPGDVFAQGLLFNLPDDGSGVEYEGTLTQADGPNDQNPLSWSCELSIKSVGKEQAEYNGTLQACRWIEIKTLTGKSGAAGIDPGPVGSRIYKILVPESRIIGDWQDSDGIPNDMIPIVRGFRRLGEEEIQPISTPALRIYPTISMLTAYKEPEVVATSDVPETLVQGRSFTAKRMRGKMTMESHKVRSTNQAEFWVADDIPFGLARWIVTISTDVKDSAAPISEFKPLIVKKMDMKLRRIRTGVESELVTQ